MRRPERFDGFYEKLNELHRSFVPGWSVPHFLSYVVMNAQHDPWFWEEDRTLREIEEIFKESEDTEEKIPADHTAFYEGLRDLHKEYIPDWRFFQMIMNMFGDSIPMDEDNKIDDTLLLHEMNSYFVPVPPGKDEEK